MHMVYVMVWLIYICDLACKAIVSKHPTHRTHTFTIPQFWPLYLHHIKHCSIKVEEKMIMENNSWHSFFFSCLYLGLYSFRMHHVFSVNNVPVLCSMADILYLFCSQSYQLLRHRVSEHLEPQGRLLQRDECGMRLFFFFFFWCLFPSELKGMLLNGFVSSSS